MPDALPSIDGSLQPELLSETTRQRLGEVRRGLLHLHKALLEVEQRSYEQLYGRVESGGALLQLLIHSPWFAWLRPLSEMVVQIDELLEGGQNGEEPATQGQGDEMLRQIRALLTPSEEGAGFPKRYHQALQQDPNSILAHAQVSRLLPPPGVAGPPG
jgi:hypothetical protein